jgi:hypothetical protein
MLGLPQVGLAEVPGSLLNDLKLLDPFFIDSQAESRHIVIEIDEAVLGSWLAVEDNTRTAHCLPQLRRVGRTPPWAS